MHDPYANGDNETCPAAATVQDSIIQQPLTRTESLSGSQQSTAPVPLPEQSPEAQEPQLPPVSPVTVTEAVATISEPLDRTTIVAGSIADKVQQETVKSGHGVASDGLFQHRQPQAVSDPDSLKDEDYLLDRCTSLLSC